jgi:hypothetical protein
MVSKVLLGVSIVMPTELDTVFKVVVKDNGTIEDRPEGYPGIVRFGESSALR